MKCKFTCLIVLLFALVIPGKLKAQSPYLKFEAYMDADLLKGDKYRMVGSFCTPVERSAAKTVYGHDSSTISFKSLEKHMIQCSPVYGSEDSLLALNMFRYGNQKFGYEKIIVIRVIKLDTDMEATMQIIVPVPYQSFLTFIKIRDIIFLPGKTIWFDLPDTRVGGSLNVNISMKEFAYTEHKFPG